MDSMFQHIRHTGTNRNVYAAQANGSCDFKSMGETTASDAIRRRTASTTTRKRSHKHLQPRSSSSNNKTAAPPPAISEDEVEARKLRSDRNAREQARSQKIADQIAELHLLLDQSAVQHKQDKYHTLLCTVHYIRQLEQKASELQRQHDQLVGTLQQASQHMNQHSVGDRSSSSSISPAVVSSTSECSFSASASASDSVSQINMNGERLEPEDTEEFPDGGINYKWIFDCCPFASSVTSIDGRFLKCNPLFEQLSGYTRQELLGVPDGKTRNMSIFNILHRQHIERIFAPLSEMLQYNEETRKQPLNKLRDNLSEIVELGRSEVVPCKMVR